MAVSFLTELQALDFMCSVLGYQATADLLL